ncbi:MAG: diacylglycerol kinase family lipid kinase [Flavobacteriales bacterium]|nr:diacylglycerol kinase family lipid kinase [Flavobacteriales bacterium]MBT6013794.1 diacylglycerol kinase family lipid kinase [Flavobacteriales bacterium]
MKTKFIVNPISGTGKQKNINQLIDKFIDKEKFEYDISFTERHLHAKEIAKQAVKDNYELLIAVGGDGTVNEISSELIGTDVSLGIIPTGSGNGFAFHFGIYKKIKNAILQINKSKVKIVDSCNANGIPFVNVSGIGFDAHIANLFTNKTERGFSNYIKLIYKELKYQAREYTIKYDGKTENINALLISFANATQYGNNFQISPNSKIDDGLIDFVILKDMPRWKVPQILLKIAKGKSHLSKYIRIIQSDKMTIISNENVIHLDGEPTKINGELTIKVNPKSLKIFAPNG